MVGTRAKRQSPSRVPAQGVANVAADEVPKHAFETGKSMEVPVVGTHERQSPSRIPAQFPKDRRPDRGLTYPLNPSNSCRKPSKTHLLGSHKIGTKSSRTDGWKHLQTVGLEKRKRRKQDSRPRGGQLWRQTGAQPSKPLKAWRYRWWVPAQGVANCGGRQVPKHAFETAKSMEAPVVGTHAKRQSPSRIPAQGVANVAADEVPKWWARMRHGRAPWIPAGRQVPKQHRRNR